MKSVTQSVDEIGFNLSGLSDISLPQNEADFNNYELQNPYDKVNASVRIFLSAFDTLVASLAGANCGSRFDKGRRRNDAPLSGDLTPGHQQPTGQ